MSLLQKALAAASSQTAPAYIDDLFSTYLYTGTGASKTITTDVDTSTGGGMVWIKGRTTSTDHAIYDTVRGATKELVANSTNVQTTESTGLTAFSTTGFTVGALSKLNTNTGQFSAWSFKKAKKFFDVQTKSHTSGSSSTVNLSDLGTVGCVMVRGTGATNWYVWHRSLTAGTLLYLNATDLPFSSSLISVSGTTLTLSSSLATGTYVVYAFAHDAGGFGSSGSENAISCGSFTATSNVAVTLGYEPQFLLVKNVDFYDVDLGIGENWYILDTMRGMSHANARFMYPNTTDQEANSTSNLWKPTPTGFISTVNNSEKHIYIAIRRGPMRAPTDATKVFKPVKLGLFTGDSNASIPTDSQWLGAQGGTTDKAAVLDRLRGVSTESTTAEASKALATNSSNSENNIGSITQGWSSAEFLTPPFSNGSVSYAWNFRRAYGFFDTVIYSGTGSARTVTHSLGVVPELMIVKKTSASADWWVYHSAVGNTKYLVLNSTVQSTSSSTAWNNTTPTSSVFSVGTASEVNASGATHIAYLFASVSGVSKVGSYTGNGSSQTINCGFASGARFILIRRATSGVTGFGGWYGFDTSRGIVSGNDIFTRLEETTLGDQTAYDAVDPDSTGFIVNQNATNFPINTSGETYIFLAIA